MPRRHRRLLSSWPSLTRSTPDGSRRHVDRATVVGSAPIITGTGFVLSRTVAIAIANAPAVTFLWGLVIGLAFATAGIVFLFSTEGDARRRSSVRSARTDRVPLATTGGVLALALLTGAVLGTVL